MNTEDHFVSAIKSMLSRDEYLIPYVWAQRLLRRDNYQMASQALLEDMFYDTLGDFLNRHLPEHSLDRRNGAEAWDYKFDGTGFSHKEGMQRLIVSKWQAGEGPKNKEPRWPTWTFTESVTFAYTNLKATAKVRIEMPLIKGGSRTIARNFRALTYSSDQEKAFRESAAYVAVCSRADSGDSLNISRLITAQDWMDRDFRSVRSLAPQALYENEIFWFSMTKEQMSKFIDPTKLHFPIMADIETEDFSSGIYVLDQRSLIDLPQSSNNKAHFVTHGTLDLLMSNACQAGRFIPMPLWPALYTDMTPPNLYQDLRNRYDALFQARSSRSSITSDLMWPGTM
ncbi:hypothetical protein HQ496_08540 [bacterium]|nr:hypothetical protein [bacterium]